MRWFKHDADASIDAKLQELLLDYGASGYGLYWYCVELIAQNVNENNITFELEHDARIIAKNLNLTLQETKDMMQKMITLGLFTPTKNQRIACYALARRLDQSMTSNPQFRAFIKNVKENHDAVMINHDLVMLEEKRREEKRLEEKREDTCAGEDEFPSWLNVDLWQRWVLYRKEIKKTLKPSTIKLQLKLLESNQYDQDAIINQSIQNGWTGLFEIKKQTAKKSLAERNREALDAYEQRYSEDVIDGVIE